MEALICPFLEDPWLLSMYRSMRRLIDQSMVLAGEESSDGLEEMYRKPVSTVIVKLPDGRIESRAIFEDGWSAWFVFGDPLIGTDRKLISISSER